MVTLFFCHSSLPEDTQSTPIKKQQLRTIKVIFMIQNGSYHHLNGQKNWVHLKFDRLQLSQDGQDGGFIHMFYIHPYFGEDEPNLTYPPWN